MDKKSIIPFLCFLQVLINAASNPLAKPPPSEPLQKMNTDIFKCRDSEKFQPGSEFDLNLKLAFDQLISAEKSSWYFKYVGDKPGSTATAMAMCLGYVNVDQCVVCIKTAIPMLRQKCPNQKEAVAWMQKCMIHYSGNFKEFDPWFWAFLGDTTKVPENEVLLFEQKKGNLMLELSAKAAAINQAPKYSTDAVVFGSKTTNQGLKYSTGTAAFGSKTIYMAMQCSPYLLQDTCNQCFLTIHFTIGVATKGDVAYAMFSPYCYMKYALYDFRK